MATFHKYDQFVEDLANKVHDLMGTHGSGADTCKVMLSNAAPDAAADEVRADATEITAEHGYSSGGASATNIGSQTSGTFALAGTDITWTATGGTIGPFQYAILYNDTPTSPADPLIGWWDYGSPITLSDTQTFTVDFGASILTVA